MALDPEHSRPRISYECGTFRASECRASSRLHGEKVVSGGAIESSHLAIASLPRTLA
jgi:hypothetical protein